VAYMNHNARIRALLSQITPGADGAMEDVQGDETDEEQQEEEEEEEEEEERDTQHRGGPT